MRCSFCIFSWEKILGRSEKQKGKQNNSHNEVCCTFLPRSVSVSCPTAVFDRQVGYCLNERERNSESERPASALSLRQ